MVKKISLLLAVLMAASVFASCQTVDTVVDDGTVSGTASAAADNSAGNEETAGSEGASVQAGSGQTASGAKASSGSTASNSNDPNYGKLREDKVVDMKGYEFVIGSPWLKNAQNESTTLAESLFYQRRKEVETAYNCKIKVEYFYPDQATMLPKIMGNQKIADVINMSMSMMIPAALLGQIVPLNETKGIYVDDARWVDAYTNISTINNKVYGLNFNRPPEARGCLFYNKDMIKNSSKITEDPQELALKGQWTYEKFRAMCIAATQDLNNDGTPDKYGFMPVNVDTTPYMFTMANDAPLVVKDSSGKWVENFNSQKFINAANFYYKLVNEDKVTKIWDNQRKEATFNDDKFQDSLKFFADGNVAFISAESWLGCKQLKPLSNKVNYGILPIPKGPDAKEYYSFCDNGNVFCITSTNKDVEKTVTIFNAVARPLKDHEGEDWWQQDVQTEYFRAGDVNSTKLYKMILDSSRMDIGCGVADLSKGVGNIFRNAVYWRNDTMTSMLKASQGNYDIYLKALLNK